jgi:hypothetical protein
MSNSTRKGEVGYLPERTERIFQKGIYWYFRTREDVIIGPFDSRELACKGSSDYVEFAVNADPHILGSLAK